MRKTNIKTYFKRRKTGGRRAGSLKPCQSTDPVVLSHGYAENAPTCTKREKEIEILRDFDNNWIYGPCIGISRSERWDRAAKFGLLPPQEVIDLINNHLDEKKYTESLWNEYILLR